MLKLEMVMLWRSKFNTDISNWNVSNLCYMQNMFYMANFNGDLSKWDVRNVKDAQYIFGNSPMDSIFAKTPKFYQV